MLQPEYNLCHIPADSVSTASASAVPSVPVSNPPADPIAPDPNRPVSTIPADSTQTPTPVQPSQADPVDQVFEASASAQITPPADPEASASGSIDSSPPVPQPPQVPQQSDVQAPVASPAPTETQSPPVSVQPEVPKESSIHDPSSSNEPSQVQPEAPKDVPVTQVENTPPQSAGIIPEPPQDTQNAPSADVKVPESPKTSFGDLMGTPADLSEEPAIHIDPIEAPPIAPATPPVAPPTQPTEENQQAALAIRRQHATEARKQKREENLAKVIELAQKKGKIDNLDVRDFLHISQTTATDYLHTLVNSGKLKKEGKAKATVYFL
mgnify:FL=1